MNDKLIKLAQVPLEVPDNLEELLYKLIEEKKVFTDDIETLKSIANLLISGKHIVLYGPVGTGKTKLVKEIANVFNVDLEIAHVGENWQSDSQLIGYKTIFRGGIKFNKGHFVKTLEKCYRYIEEELYSTFNFENTKQACWLVLDEMNRGNINGYLSSIITALEPLRANLTKKDFEDIYKIFVDTGQELIKIPIPYRFRMIGTINTFDMNFLYSFPSALEGRRLDFVPVNPPVNINYELDIIQNVLVSEFPIMKSNMSVLENLLSEIKNLIKNLRGIGFSVGTAIFMDIGRESINRYILFNTGRNELREILDYTLSTKLPQIVKKLVPDKRREIIEYLNANNFSKTVKELNNLLTEIIEDL